MTDATPSPEPIASPEATQSAEPTLDELEADIAAVEAAMASLERITAEVTDGEAAAAQVRSVVSPQRFPLDGEPVAGSRHGGER